MKLDFRELNIDSDTDLSYLEKWNNDPELRPLVHQHHDIFDLCRFVPKKKIRKRILGYKGTYRCHLILLNDLPIGEVSFMLSTQHMIKKERDAAWVGIMIGENRAQGQGIGTKAMQYLENLLQQMGIRRIELGVFEYNARAIGLYRKLQYHEFHRTPDFTYWNGKLWTDIRFEKYLGTSL